MGRKRTSPDERRSEAVTILLKPGEMQRLRQAAQEYAQSVSSYCRDFLFSQGAFSPQYPRD